MYGRGSPWLCPPHMDKGHTGMHGNNSFTLGGV